MLTRLKLERFKNFENAELPLGPLTVLVGANATGKSNIRDAFRFLHGIARGYTLAEIFDTKYIGGSKEWLGIRGGTREVAFQPNTTFALEVDFETKEKKKKVDGKYRIEIEVGKNGKSPRVVHEELRISPDRNPRPPAYIFHPDNGAIKQSGSSPLNNQVADRKRLRESNISVINNKPALSGLAEDNKENKELDKFIKYWKRNRQAARIPMKEFESMRFMELSPDAMRLPSTPGQTVLGDRGENLSSVLQAICEDRALKKALLEWLRELTPMDAKDFIFIPDQTGKILVSLKEKNGQTISAYSASDGTLRFLAMLAALLGPDPARFYFFEELDNGIHPTRLYLLLQLIEQKVSEGKIQMVASTHSPQLLGLLSPQALEFASLTYRLENRPEARIQRILDIPHAQEVLKTQDLARLHASGWMENVEAFLEAENDE
jgi:predicted ATPase